MNGIHNSADDVVECPLCMEPLEVDDLNFYPCTCGYQICRFCWHRIRTDENKLCPACRKEYPENPADFTPLTQEQMIAFKSQKRQRDQQRKQKITENRKHLANVRVVQKNLVFVVGLPPRLADADILKKHEYFGKYGKIHKVVINPSTTYAGVQGPSASAYVTYVHNSDALRAIQSVNNIMIDGRLIKTSLGTTKYCSHFMKNQQCPKSDCMYLHELGDPEASFTKEEMHQGKHQEYEKRLHDTLIASAGTNTGNGVVGQTTAASSGVSAGGTSKINASSMSSSSSSSTSVSSTVGTQNSAPGGVSPTQKEAWPSLAVSPVHSKDTPAIGNSATNKNKKDKQRNDKSRNEKSSKQKTKNVNHSNSNTSNKENHLPITEDHFNATIPTETALVTTAIKSEQNKSRADRIKDKSATSRTNFKETQQQHQEDTSSTDLPIEEGKSIEETDKMCEQTEQTPNRHASDTLKNEEEAGSHRSLSSSSNISDGRASGLSESSTSGKSSPGSYQNSYSNSSNANTYKTASTVEIKATLDNSGLSKVNTAFLEKPITDSTEVKSPPPQLDANIRKESDITNSADSFLSSDGLSTELPVQNNIVTDNILDATAGLSKLNMFDDSNSFFSSTPSFQQSLFLKNKIAAELRQNQINNISSSHLPDLLNGIDGYQKSTNANEWEEAFKNVMMRNNKHVEEQLLHQQHLQQQQQQHHQQLLQQQEEFLRMHELQKRNNLLNNIAHSQINDFPSSFNGNADLSRLSNSALTHQQQQLLQQSNDSMIPNNLFAANMSKFFDFHKTQQQLHQQTDPLRMSSFLENNRVNSQYIDNNIQTQQQFQKQRLLGKMDSVPQTQGSQSQQNVLPNQFSQNTPVDDDLGFDPFIETQKGLAELMENEVVHKQNTNLPSVAKAPSKLLQHQQVSQQQQMLDNMQRARMPPPGFNHMNSFGFGVQRTQNTNKSVPFMNLAANGGNSTQVGQQLQIPVSNNWSPHMHAFSQQSQHQQPLPMNETQLLLQLNQAQSSGNHSKGYGANDWTAMDPAILSFRQFSSFPQTQMPPHPQQQQDLFMQHLAQQQQQQQQNGQGFSNQTQHLNGMSNVPNNLLNVQPSSQAQVNANVQGMLEFLKNRQFV